MNAQALEEYAVWRFGLTTWRRLVTTQGAEAAMRAALARFLADQHQERAAIGAVTRAEDERDDLEVQLARVRRERDQARAALASVSLQLEEAANRLAMLEAQR